MNSRRRETFWRRFCHTVLIRPLVRALLGVNVIGRENQQGLDRFIVIANHNSHLDILLLFYVLPARQICRTHVVADEVYFSKNRLVFRLVEFLYKPIWVTRGQLESKTDPLGRIKACLDAGDNLIVFPEGTRGAPGELLPFRSGIGRLVAQYPDIPVLPVFLTGPERSLPKGSALLLPLWNNVIIGPAHIYRGTHREITHHLQDVLTELARSEAARRHHRERRPPPPKCIAFLGIDGSGKSTASRAVAEQLSMSGKVCRISDELELFEHGQATNLQPLFSERVRTRVSQYAKGAKSLKLYKLPKLADLLLRDHLQKEVARWYKPSYVVMDGSPLLNLLAWSVLYKSESMDTAAFSRAIGVLTGSDKRISKHDPLFVRYPELLQLKRLGVNKMKMPDVAVFIDVPSHIACQRIISRGEKRQVHENEEKLGRLRDGYRMVCDVIREEWSVKVLIVDGTGSREEILKESLHYIAAHANTEVGGREHSN